MKSKIDKHKRKSLRLKEYDYSKPGYYYVTVCTFNKRNLFGMIENDKMKSNRSGQFTEKCLKEIPSHFSNSELDYYVIMPNHIHFVVVIKGQNVGAENLQPHSCSSLNEFQNIIPRSLGSIVKGFKIGVTKWFRRNTNIHNVWQRNYYERIIRNDKELYEIRKYIEQNPLKWALDEYHNKNYTV